MGGLVASLAPALLPTVTDGLVPAPSNTEQPPTYTFEQQSHIVCECPSFSRWLANPAGWRPGLSPQQSRLSRGVVRVTQQGHAASIQDFLSCFPTVIDSSYDFS